MEKLDKVLPLLIKTYRKRASLSQEQLAHQSGLDRTYISFLERGLRKPTLHTIFHICNALEIRTSEFVEEIEKAIENTTESNID